ncbi:MAG: hypothetical protein KDC98_26385, partial [Planctomycetes bacterium]|nr:hypothetical protein [Planctomycetota bacterium]
SYINEYPFPSPVFVGGGPAVPVGPMPAPAAMLLPAPHGSIAFDDTTGIVYTTNGVGTIQRSWYPRLGCVPPAVVLPALPIPAGVGPIFGMAVDSVTKHIFVNNGATIFRLNPMAGMAVVMAWATGVPNLTDLEFDPALPGQLFGVRGGGGIVNYNVGGGILGMMGPSYVVPAGGIAVGLALDQSSPVGAPHFFTLWDNGQIYNQNLAALHTTVPANNRGLCFIAAAQVLPGAGAIGGVVPEIRTSAMCVTGTGFGFEMCNAPAGTWSGLALKVGVPGAPVPLGGIGTFWLAGGWLAPLVYSPTTTAAYPLPIPAGLVGFRFYGQWIADFFAFPAGSAFTDALQVEVAN